MQFDWIIILNGILLGVFIGYHLHNRKLIKVWARRGKTVWYLGKVKSANELLGLVYDYKNKNRSAIAGYEYTDYLGSHLSFTNTMIRLGDKAFTDNVWKEIWYRKEIALWMPDHNPMGDEKGNWDQA